MHRVRLLIHLRWWLVQIGAQLLVCLSISKERAFSHQNHCCVKNAQKHFSCVAFLRVLTHSTTRYSIHISVATSAIGICFTKHRSSAQTHHNFHNVVVWQKQLLCLRSRLIYQSSKHIPWSNQSKHEVTNKRYNYGKPKYIKEEECISSSTIEQDDDTKRIEEFV